MSDSKKERYTNYDFMRLLMSVFVIYVHSPKPLRIENSVFWTNFMYIFTMQCNAIFFMLSGKFALNKKFEEKKDYIDYYKSKFITILIPYGLVSCLLVLAAKPFTGIKEYILNCGRAIFFENPSSHLWYVCLLIGYLISAPFLAKMLQSMKKSELKILFAVGILWNIYRIYIVTDLHLQEPINGWFLAGWIFSFILGYVYDKVIDDENRKWWYLFGVIGFVVSVLGRAYLPTFEYPASESVAFIIFTMASFVFLEKHTNFKNQSVAKTVGFLAKYSYVAYIVHYFIKSKYELVLLGRGIKDSILFVSVVFVTSYAVSILVTVVLIKPIQKLLFKWMGKSKKTKNS